MLSEYYEVVAVSSPGEKMKVLEEREGVRTVSISMERRISLVKDFISLLRLIILFAKERPDMVHSITPKAGLLSMLAAWITGVPVRMHTFTGLVFPTVKDGDVISLIRKFLVSGVMMDDEYKESVIGKMQKLLIVMDRLTCFCATHINPEGEGVKRDLINYNITSKPLHVIANGNVNGIDLEYFDRTPEVMEKAYSYKKEGTFTFCFVGRMVKDKGINELVHSFLRLYQDDARVRLLLVGPFEKELDPVLPEVEEQILHHPGICFMGFQSDVRSFLAASDALVFPSYREGFPNVVIQAGAMGIPAIVTDINGCNEIVLPDRNGMIIPTKNEQALYEAMKYFASHSVEVEKMAANARPLIVSRYEQRMVWNALLTEYKSII